MDCKLNIDIFQICRTCVKEITSGSSFFYLDYSPIHTHLTIGQKLNNCIPELDLSIVSDVVICSKCADDIKSFYEFKQKCLELEIQIKKYIQQVQHIGDINLVEVVHFHELHNRNDTSLDTKFKIKDIELPTEDIKNEDLGCDIDALHELDECTEPIEPAYLHQPHNKILDMTVKIDDVATAQDFKIEDEANEGKESMEPTYFPTRNEIDRQYVLFNTTENCIDGDLLAAKHLATNNSNISQDDFNQNLRKRAIYYQCYRCGHKAASKLKLILHLKRHTPRKDLISEIPSKHYKHLFRYYYRCSLCNYLTKYKCLFSVHNRIHLTKKDYRRIFQHKDNQTKFFVTTINYNKINVQDDKRKYIKHPYNQHNFKDQSKHIESTQHFGHHSSLKSNTKTNVKKSFKCSICEYQFNQKASLKRHLLTHTGDKRFSCSICEYRCNHKSQLKIHIQTHTEEKPFTCFICKYQFSQKGNLKRHLLSHTGEKPFSCSVCKYQCSRKSKLKEHGRIHTGEKPFKCSICQYQSIRKASLTRHIRLHTGEKPFSCSVCEYRSNSKSNLKQHIRIHTGEKPFSCTVCEYQCSHKSTLKDHIQIHTGEKPFSCSFCEYRCIRKKYLNQHMLTHTGEKPFSCSVCKYQCIQKIQLKQHIQIHTGKKSLSCSFCEYQCSRKGDLNRHMVIHTGEKPFSCSVCKYRCSRKQTLKQHMQIHT